MVMFPHSFHGERGCPAEKGSRMWRGSIRDYDPQTDMRPASPSVEITIDLGPIWRILQLKRRETLSYWDAHCTVPRTKVEFCSSVRQRVGEQKKLFIITK